MSMITADDVADELGLTVDQRMSDCTEAAVAWVVRQRSITDATTLWDEQDTRRGAILYACLLYQSRVTPAGIAGYAELGTYNADTWEALQRVRELVGVDPVIA